MRYNNLKDPRLKFGFRDAVIRGISSDMGLFMPETVPVMEPQFFERLPELSLTKIAIEVGARYVGNDIPSPELERICTEAFDFPVVLREIDGRKQVLELFHGPTAAFKDFGARFMAGCFRYFASHDGMRTVVLVATSGDTGGAIASSFLGVEGVDVMILYPSGKVSTLQENQMATLGQNITAIEVEGTFDDCQAMVKGALTTLDTGSRIRLTSANSINIARLIPQSFYYYYAVGRAGGSKVISVPSGNFGNITAAAMAWKSGLDIDHLVAATNINKVVPEYLSSGVYTPAISLQTIASAMDVGNPGNFPRLTRLFDDEFCRITSGLSGYWFDDGQIREHIRAEYERTGYILDPHGAVASLGLDSYLEEHPGKSGIFVETAHPGKFTGTVEPLIETEVEMPDSLQGFMKGKKETVVMKSGSEHLADFLTGRYSPV
ncbi:MAG: threonine synthase [Bacteroidales bacterium]|nr:threonine synthase [Bacteroidales bacterium]MDT8373860.1 threonine synthase [Bacteroidales bacterium]